MPNDKKAQKGKKMTTGDFLFYLAMAAIGVGIAFANLYKADFNFSEMSMVKQRNLITDSLGLLALLLVAGCYAYRKKRREKQAAKQADESINQGAE